ncbi:hypothetical protein RUND412_010431 [Rhizina undulata]
MAEPNVAALLAALTGAPQQRPPTAQAAPPMPQVGPQGYPGLPAGLGAPSSQQAPSNVASPPTGYALPQHTSVGGVDLSKIKPSSSGKVSLNDAVAKARARAAEMRISQGHRGDQLAPHYDERPRYVDPRDRERSRSPPSRRGPDPYRDAYNAFRDERRGRAGNDYNSRERERSYSPPRRGGAAAHPYSPPPARNERFAGHRARSPPPDAEQMNIDSSLVGLIIGRGGENLRRVEADTGARVQFLTNGQDRDSGGERVCNIQGNRQQISAARRAIETIIAENAATQTSGGPSGPPGPGRGKFGGATGAAQPVRDGSVSSSSHGGAAKESLQIMVPDRTVGLIIGRGGETIRDIQDKSGCHVNIVGEAKSQNGLRPVNLIGNGSAAEHARRLIMEIVESDNATNGPPPSRGAAPERGSGGGGYYGGHGDGGGGGRGAQEGRITETIRVPIDAVGMIIGKGGETIKEMQSSTGCRINVSSQFNQGDPEREISLAGNRDAIMRARQVIEEKVEASQNKPRTGNRSGNNANPGSSYNSDSQQHQHQQQQQQQQQAAWAQYAQQSQQPQNSAPPGTANGQDAAVTANDPYAPYGGYQAYCAMYYAAMMQQQAQGGAAPGT